MVDDDLEAAWGQVFDALPAAWAVGSPSYHDERHEWTRYAFDPFERPSIDVRSREWTAIGPSELECLLDMAPCLRQPGEGRVPR